MMHSWSFSLLAIIFLSAELGAHGGGKDALGCHKSSRTNEYHCHNSNHQPPVKLSKSMICHKKGGPYYSRTKNFVPFQSLEKCIGYGGRLPKK